MSDLLGVVRGERLPATQGQCAGLARWRRIPSNIAHFRHPHGARSKEAATMAGRAWTARAGPGDQYRRQYRASGCGCIRCGQPWRAVDGTGRLRLGIERLLRTEVQESTEVFQSRAAEAR